MKILYYIYQICIAGKDMVTINLSVPADSRKDSRA